MQHTSLASMTAIETLSLMRLANMLMRSVWSLTVRVQTPKRCTDFHQTILIFLAAFVLLPSITQAQSSTTTARTPGTPAGSYKLGDADTINLFTGNLNFHLPLLGVGGRGEAQAGLGVDIEGQWDMQISDAGNGYSRDEYSFRQPNPFALVGSVAIGISSETNEPCTSGGDRWVTYRVSMTYVEPDGTEHSLRDRVSHGMPLRVCGGGGQGVGRIFESTSGDFVTFITDTDIYSSCYGISGCTDNPDGYLYFRDGTKSRVVGGKILWTQDRNGNKIEYTYDPNYNFPNALPRVTSIKDSIGREIDIAYDVSEPSPYGLCNKITYKGFGGQQDKIIRVSLDDDLSHNLLRTTQPGDATTPINPIYDDPNDNVVPSYSGSLPLYIKAVWLPDGRSYQFKYNVLSQLARVVLPTGGAIEYDFVDVTKAPYESPPNTGGNSITNRVSEKRIYSSNNTLVSRTVFSTPTSYTSGVIPPARGATVRDIELFDPSGNRLSKSRHYFYGAPNSGYGLLVPWWHGKEFRTETFDSDGTTILRVAETDWRQRVPSWCTNTWPCLSNPTEVAPTNNPFIVETRLTLADGNLVSKVSAVNPSNSSWAFDAYNNQTDVWQYDFGSGQAGSLVKHTQTSYTNNANASGGLYLLGLVNTASVYTVNSSGQETLASSSQIVYDEYTQYPLLTYDTVTEWQDPGSVRGNPTTVRQWLDTNNSWVETHAQFDQLGNVRKSFDALGRMSETSYTDAFTDSVNHNTYAFPTLSTSPIPDSDNVHGSNSAFVSSSVYDYSSGLVKTSTDINGQTTTLEYNDPLNRLTKIINPTGGGWTSFEYSDTVGNLYVKTTTAFDETRNLTAYTYFDGLGRSVRSFSPKGGGIWVVGDTQYDAAGRIWRVSKPYQTDQSPSFNSGVNPANNWLTTQYDALGRAVIVTTADGSQAQTSYSGNTVTVTDAALKKRKTVSDALGRLTQVIEDPGGANFTTNYKYDVLGNLRKVDQGTQQHRYYMYDSLSRLIRSRNPEQDANPDLAVSDPVTNNDQWSAKIDYYVNGNVSARTDARGIKIEYLYDNLNRLYRRTYTATRTLPAGTYATTPAVDYYYDGRGLSSAPQNTLGKLTCAHSSVSEMRYTGFDAMGRVTSSQQVIDGQTYQMPSYTYNLAGSLLTQTYPSGRTVKNDYDDGGKLSVVSGQVPTQTWKTYASDFDYSYTNSGAVSQMKLGNGRWESVVYNKRLQPTIVGLGTTHNGTELMKLEYGYGGTDNNGNLHTQTITVPTSSTSPGFTATQSYGYDNLNRLTSATETSGGQTTWQQGFSYDQWGNRAIVKIGQYATTSALVGDDPTISTTTNRIMPQTGEYYQYDDAGNLTHDRLNNTYSFDGENKQSTFTNAGAGQSTAQYYYDGDGRRVKKVVGNETTIFVYNAFNQLVAEYSTNPSTITNPTTYLTADNQGTPRVNTDSSGNVAARHDYLPFGEEISGLGGRANHAEYRTDSIRQKYTGYEHDLENGLDYAQARYYASQSGRFTSVDPLMASAGASSPQTFNRYTYALNNPYKYVDPSGMEPHGLDDETEQAFGQLNGLADYGFALWLQEQDAAREEARRQQQQQQMAQQIDDLMGHEQPPEMPQQQEGQVMSNHPQDTFVEGGPDTIDNKGSGQNCSISVSFTGVSPNGGKNGPNEMNSAIGPVFGVGFTVTISNLGSSRINSLVGNQLDSKGGWTLEQQAGLSSGRTFRLGDFLPASTSIPLHPDPQSNLATFYNEKNRSAGWFDHPGFNKMHEGKVLMAASGRFEFLVKAVNGRRTCELGFHIDMRYYGGRFSAQVGRGIGK
jgi:RHS repeat-associated protein